VRGPQALAGITMEILMEQEIVFPERILLKTFLSSIDRPVPFPVRNKEYVAV
jgi:hypothetical protein